MYVTCRRTNLNAREHIAVPLYRGVVQRLGSGELYETRYRTRVIDNLRRRAKTFEFVLRAMEPTLAAVS